MAKQNKSPERRLAESIAAQKGIKVKSAMRYIQRAAAPVGKQRIIKPKFAGLKPTTAKRAKREVKQKITVNRERLEKELKARQSELNKVQKVVKRLSHELYPSTVGTGASIQCDYLPNPVANQSAAGKTIVKIHARFEISKDNSKRWLRLKCTQEEIEQIIASGSLFDAVANWTNTEDGSSFLQGAMISEIEKMEIE